MKKFLFCALALAGAFVGSAAEAKKPAEPAPMLVTVVVDDATNVYNLASCEAKDDVKGAKEYVEKYADNVQHDKEFKAHEAQALATVRQTNRFFGSWWAIFPPLLAILLALITKEVYSSLFIGIVSGGLLYAGFSLEGTLTHTMQAGFISSIANAYNIGIVLFLVLLGALVAMMNKTGASAAFGRGA